MAAPLFVDKDKQATSNIIKLLWYIYSEIERPLFPEGPCHRRSMVIKVLVMNVQPNPIYVTNILVNFSKFAPCNF